MPITKQGIQQVRVDVSGHDTDIKADVGDFSAQTNLQTLLAVLGWPDVSGETVFKELITDRLDSATFGLSNLKTLIDAIPTTMVGTDGAALASVLGALADAAAANDPTSADTASQYLKQIVNILEGTDGIAGWTAAAAPGNGVSLPEVIRQIYDDLTLVLADTGTDGVVVNSRTAVADRIAGEQQVIEVSVTAALNAGVTVIATVTDQPVVIDSVVLHADTAAHADMTTAAIEGGASQVVEFIGTADATEANLNAIDKQVGWTGVVRLAATKTITIDLQGVGATAADLTVTITYHAAVDGGYLA